MIGLAFKTIVKPGEAIENVKYTSKQKKKWYL